MSPRMENSISEETPLIPPASPISDFQKSTNKDESSSSSSSLWNRMKAELIEQMDTAIPTVQSMVLTKIPWLISLRFVGEIGADELAAAALATTLCNVTGLSLSVGLSSALSTLAGQAKGELLSRRVDEQRSIDVTTIDLAGESNSLKEETTSASTNPQRKDSEPLMPLVYLYRGMVIQLALVIPVGIWWMFGIKDFLIYLGQEESLSARTEVCA